MVSRFKVAGPFIMSHLVSLHTRALVRSAVSALTLALALFASAAAAQTGGESTPSPEKLIHAQAAAVSVPAGGRATVVVTLTVLPGWHVNANPPALEYNIPTTVSLQGASGLTPGRVTYPKGKQQKFGFEDAPLLVWDGVAEVRVPIAAALDAKSGTLTGAVEFQACNDQVCLPPASVPFTVAVTVTEAIAGATPAL
jgi:DsbC/DsbD-like thiol-disulfide interchange protein